MQEALELRKTCWHEAGHAIWVLESNLSPQKKHGPDIKNPFALTCCILPDEEGPILGTMEHIEWMLSGPSAEKVFCDSIDAEFEMENQE